MSDPNSGDDDCATILAAVREIFPDALSVTRTPQGFRVSQARSAHMLPDDWCRSVLASAEVAAEAGARTPERPADPRVMSDGGRPES